tara:strand:+ start:2539 stop:3444 length:906 start_codon:yes stop_codon:yes gene_type:complete
MKSIKYLMTYNMKNQRKGIILAGGSGTRLYPITEVVSKQLMPIYDKPMIYYPLSILMLSDIREVLIISTPSDTPKFKQLLGDGKKWGMEIRYAIQQNPEGIAQAFIIGKNFINNNPCALILGDNIFYGDGLSNQLKNSNKNIENATIFGYKVSEPWKYGVIEFNNKNRIISINEKPLRPKSNYAVTGLYFYDNQVCDIAKEIKPSKRGELEITDVNKVYLKKKKLNLEILGRGCAWLDTGSFDNMLEASSFVATLQKRQGYHIACPEEISFKKKWINKSQLVKLAKKLQKNSYGQYLLSLI